MSKQLLVALILSLILLPSISEAKKFTLNKSDIQRDLPLRVHPLQQEFEKPREPSRSRDGNKLLVLLIEFNDNELVEDNPLTTGRGKFIQDPTGYPLTLGKPPHDHEFFSMQLEALKHYYRAASLYYDFGWNTVGFDLQYDIYPQPESDNVFRAYTLPEDMAYYTPTDVDYSVLVSRFEEYFQQAFAIADQDENIDFSQYDHFMFIHAGSDWQHDIQGDTPSDMPSFFIQIGTGMEVYVDDGVMIDHACNVPEMISQDFQFDQVGDIQIVEGYGLINAVMAHEFGHSVGFVDLYNTLNNYPAVGYYDIMDSGGLGRLTFPVNQNGEIDYENYQYIFDLEGCLPILPGAWSRIITWEDDFRARGILKDISQLEFNELIELSPAERKTYPGTDYPYFLKLPLTDTEYVLIENRQVDPDGDGGTAVQSSDDRRVILYPTPISDENPDTISYEYDYLMPGWFTPTGEAIGGGLLIWHIDNERLQENDNFANNTVNPSRLNRAVKIIEADNIEDIGNPEVPSWSWRGTEYDPFYKFAAVLNDEGEFLNWDIPSSSTDIYATHNDSLSGISSPALITNDGIPSYYAVYNISSYDLNLHTPRFMSFKIGSYLFDDIEVLTEKDTLYAIGSIGDSFDFDSFPLVSSNGVDFFTNINGEWVENAFGETVDISFQPTIPIINMDYLPDEVAEKEEFLIIEGNVLNFITPLNSVENPPYQIEFSSNIIDAPMLIEDKLIVPTETSLYIDNESLPISYSKILYDQEHILAFSEDIVHFIDPLDPNLSEVVSIPGSFTLFSPVTFIDTLDTGKNCSFIQNDRGDILKLSGNEYKKIFNLYSFTDALPTQLALGNFADNGSVNLVFAAENRVFAIDLEGTLLDGFPLYLENLEFQPLTYPIILEINADKVTLFSTESQGYLAVDNQAAVRIEYSFFWNRARLQDHFYWNDTNSELTFLYGDNENHLYSSALHNTFDESIIWKGYRNQGISTFYGHNESSGSGSQKMIAYAFPNPASNGEVRIKVIDDSENISLKIFDIAGNLVLNKNYQNLSSDQIDLIWDTRNISSGVYYGVVKAGSSVKKIPIAIEN